MRKREGIEPRHKPHPWMPTWFATRKATPKKPKVMALEGPPGSKTVAHHYGRVGNSGGPIDSSRLEVGWHNRQTGRKPNGLGEVGCPHSSEEMA